MLCHTRRNQLNISLARAYARVNAQSRDKVDERVNQWLYCVQCVMRGLCRHRRTTSDSGAGERD